MAASSSCIWFLTAALLLHVAASISHHYCYRRIYSFGDSISDTGNLYYDTDTDNIPATQLLVLNLPYGETYFHHPTGRWSDGRLIIDFFAEHMGIPLVKPYLGIKNGNIRDWNPMEEGVNFAVGGATALNPSFFAEKGITGISTNHSLGVQLGWFNDLLPSICNHSSSAEDCKEFLGSSLFFVGEIGGNDFNNPLLKHKNIEDVKKNIEEVKTYVPLVINEISVTIEKLIDLGARTLVIPGNFPIGCNAIYLMIFQTKNVEEYDQVGCLKWLNKFAQYYNKKLYAELSQLQELHPHVNIIYADYYHAALPLYQSPTQFGFTKSIIDACCIPRDANNYNETVRCGSPLVNACEDPSEYISWDNIHLTEVAYSWIAKGLLNGPYTHPKLTISCDSQI